LVYLTISVLDLIDYKADISATGIKFTGKANDVNYGVELELFEEIDVDNSTQHETDRGMFLVLRKKELKEEYWPRLTKAKTRLPYVKTDFDKWVDEDEQEEVNDDFGLGGGLGGGDGLDFGGGNGLDFGDLAKNLPPGAGNLDALKSLGGLGAAGDEDVHSDAATVGTGEEATISEHADEDEENKAGEEPAEASS
jgi:hypothetical protein